MIRLGGLSPPKKGIDNDDDAISLITNPFLLITTEWFLRYSYLHMGHLYLLELLKRCGSKLARCDTHTHVKVRGKESKLVEWPWKICCGNCRRNVQLRYDADVKGRISYFDRRKYMLLSIKCV